MVECCEKREEDARIDDPLSEISWDEVNNVLPRSVIKLQEHHKRVPQKHQESPRTDEVGEVAPARHDYA